MVLSNCGKYIYNRNKMDCSKKYLRKTTMHNMLDGIKYWFDNNKRYVCTDLLEELENAKFI